MVGATDKSTKNAEICLSSILDKFVDAYKKEFYDFFGEKCKEVVDKSIKCFGKRVILGEIGIQKNAGQLTFHKGTVIDTNRYFADNHEQAYCGLMLTEMAFSAINAGIFALAYWSYVDHPDPYSCAYSSGDDAPILQDAHLTDNPKSTATCGFP